MKYILIIVICFLGLAGYSQPVNKQPRSNMPTVVDSSLAIGKNFILPVFRSFSQLATYTNLDSSGRLVFIRDSNAVFYRDNAHQWVKFNSGSSGSAVWGSITGTLSNQTDLQAVLDSKVDSVILRGGDSLYNHYATGEVQFIGLLSGGAGNDTLRVRTPLKVTTNNDTLYQNQVSDVDSGWVSPDQKAYWDAGGYAWGLEGNSGTDPLVNYVGTTDNQPLIIKVNGTQIANFGTNTGNVAIGNASTASGVASVALAGGSANGDASFAAGSGSVSSGANSIALGSGNVSSGDVSIALGSSTVASGSASTAMNFSTTANGENSTAMGFGTATNAKNSLVIGRYNDTTGQGANDTAMLFQIGNGYQGISTTVLSNLLTATYTGVGIGTTTPDSTLHLVGGLKSVFQINELSSDGPCVCYPVNTT